MGRSYNVPTPNIHQIRLQAETDERLDGRSCLEFSGSEVALSIKKSVNVQRDTESRVYVWPRETKFAHADAPTKLTIINMVVCYNSHRDSPETTLLNKISSQARIYYDWDCRTVDRFLFSAYLGNTLYLHVFRAIIATDLYKQKFQSATPQSTKTRRHSVGVLGSIHVSWRVISLTSSMWPFSEGSTGQSHRCFRRTSHGQLSTCWRVTLLYWKYTSYLLVPLSSYRNTKPPEKSSRTCTWLRHHCISNSDIAHSCNYACQVLKMPQKESLPVNLLLLKGQGGGSCNEI